MLKSTSEMAFTVWGSSSKVYDYALRTIPRLIYTAHLHVLSSCNRANKLLCGLWGQNVQLQKKLSACEHSLHSPSTAVNWSDATPFPSYLPIHYHLLKMLLTLYDKQTKKCLLTTALLKFPGQDLSTNLPPTWAQITTKDWTRWSINIHTHPYPNSASRAAMLTRLEEQLTGAIP